MYHEQSVLGSGVVDLRTRQKRYNPRKQYQVDLMSQNQELGGFFDWLKEKGITPDKIIGVAEVIAPDWTARQKEKAATMAYQAGIETARETVTTQVTEAATNPVVWVAVGGLALVLLMRPRR